MNGLLQVFTHSPGGATRWQLGVFDPLRASAYCAYSAVGESGCKSSVQTTGTNALCPEGRWQSLQASCCQEHKRAEAVSPNQMSRKPAGQKTSRRINCATRETSWHHGPDSGACLPCPVPRPLRLAQQDSLSGRVSHYHSGIPAGRWVEMLPSTTGGRGDPRSQAPAKPLPL